MHYRVDNQPRVPRVGRPPYCVQGKCVPGHHSDEETRLAVRDQLPYFPMLQVDSPEHHHFSPFFWQAGKIVPSGADAKGIFGSRLRLLRTMELFVTMMYTGRDGFVLWRLKGIRLVIMSSKNEAPHIRGCFQLFNRDPCMASEVVIKENLTFITALNDEEVV